MSDTATAAEPAASTPEPRSVKLDIGLPLPLDVVSTVGNLIDAAYPGTVIDTTAGRDVMRLLIPQDARGPRSISKEEAAAARVEADPDPEIAEMALTGWSNDAEGVSVSLTTPEIFAATLLPLVRDMLDESGAANYIEQAVSEREAPYRTFVAIACRSKEQTPHALRMKAEAAAEEARAACEKAQIERDAALALADRLLDAHGSVVMDSEGDRALHLRAMNAFRELRSAINDSAAQPE